jgi:uncharacterized protein (DUF1800 family)
MAATQDVDLISRAGIRAGQSDKARLKADGWPGWVNAQLRMPVEDAAHVQEALSKATLLIEYEAEDGFKALKEQRALKTLRTPIKDLWHLVDWDTKMAWAERIRPSEELMAATVLRATLSEAQLRESIVDFWRDHFSINRDAVEDVAVALPTYDQDVLRVHALGNFRDMLEAVASSTAMLAYLNNASSKASPANENYARELLELHSMGADAYLNASFDRWREVPGAVEGKPQGFIDQDVYEAARAFTGWTYGSGQYVSDGVNLPKTGEFTYTEKWHDPYQKRVLGIEFDPHTAPLADGRKVLDLVAFHPATAKYVCRRLCQRFVADVPSADLVASAAAVFTEYAAAKDQLSKVIAHILLSQDFANAPSRLQRPLFLLASMQRSAGVVLPPSSDFISTLEGMGQRLYGWHSPAGHPLVSAYWQSPGLIVRRWRSMIDLWTRIMAQEPNREWPSAASFSNTWADALGLDRAHAEMSTALLAKFHGDEPRKITFAEDERWFTAQALAVLSASPSYQTV